MGKIFTDVTRVLTYNAILNIVIGERGVGKSYSSKKYVIKHFLKTRKKFVYLRRYKTELKESVPKFFDDLILNKEFPIELSISFYSSYSSRFEHDGFRWT